jgi:hypothetical protein
MIRCKHVLLKKSVNIHADRQCSFESDTVWLVGSSADTKVRIVTYEIGLSGSVMCLLNFNNVLEINCLIFFGSQADAGRNCGI